MTRKKYTNYTLEELIHDQEFIETVKHAHKKKEWQNFLEENKDSKELIVRAAKIISLFEVKEGKLDPEHKYKLWIKISEFNRSNKGPNRKIQIPNFVKIAATVLIILSVASLLYFNTVRITTPYQFSQVRDTTANNNAVLILADGKKIDVQKDESEITVLQNRDAVKINNDSIYKNTLADKADNNELSLNELIVPYGKRTTVLLSDGTKVWINAGSKFAFPQKFTGKKRTVFLDGEAYFEVTKNEKQPFIVSSKEINVEVLGTKFNISTYGSDDYCETVLLEGIIDVWSEGRFINDKIRMSPNQKATYNIAEKQMYLEPEPNAEKYVAWIDGWYEFSNEDLAQVLIKLERYYNVSFSYNNEKIKKALPISGKLDLKESINEVMYIVSKVADIEYDIKGNEVIINN